MIPISTKSLFCEAILYIYLSWLKKTPPYIASADTKQDLLPDIYLVKPFHVLFFMDFEGHMY